MSTAMTSLSPSLSSAPDYFTDHVDLGAGSELLSQYVIPARHDAFLISAPSFEINHAKIHNNQVKLAAKAEVGERILVGRVINFWRSIPKGVSVLSLIAA